MSPKLKPLPWRKLSEDAAHEKTPAACQCCGQAWDTTVFIECDEADRETMTAITVCDGCEKKHIGPHARLYVELERNRPFPGAMETCVECPHRNGMSCAHPLLKANGGRGLAIHAAKPTPCFFDGDKDITGVVMDYGWTRPVCLGKQPYRSVDIYEEGR
jgi:hypothetical protein